jgi:penicillin V acylase-like amidase (Ntn superfamily)
MTRILAIALLTLILLPKEIKACSMFYYVDKTTGKIYFANNEDYWYNLNAYIQINPKSKDEFARLWYGWDNFAQGGINEFGLVFDGAVTPKQKIPEGYHNPNGRNIGDEILSKCKTVEEVVNYLEKEKIALSEGHLMFGDNTGNAVVLEWVNGEKKIVQQNDNMLIATNFLLSDTSAGNFPCHRYQSIEQRLNQLNESKDNLDLKMVGNAIAGAVQIPQKDEKGNLGGTLYTSFINVSDMEFTLVYQLDNSRITKLDLRKEFEKTQKQKIKLK